jgi:microcystin degradation protein MlrC
MVTVGIGGLIHETNTFSQTPTTLDDFLKPNGFYPGVKTGADLLKFGEGHFNIAASGFLSAAVSHNFTPRPLVWCGAEPSAPVSQKDFDTLLNLLLASLQENLPLDGLFLDLHGAMVYGSLQDGETEILRQVRKIVGQIPIVVSLDLHGNIAPESFDLASALVAYRTYPHVDAFENGVRCAEMMAHLIAKKKVYKAFRQLPFLMPSTTQATTKYPALDMYKMLTALEQTPGVYSISLMEGFPPCDMPDTGPSLFAYAESVQQAEQTADSLFEYILAHESDFHVDLLPYDEAVIKAIELADKSPKPVILADIQDNAGGGSPSDSTWLLESLVQHHAQNAALGLIYDPAAASQATKAGVGAEIELNVGGHSLPGHHPMTAIYKVIQLHEGEFTGTGPMLNGRTIDLGKMAHLLVKGVHLVVSSVRMQALDQSQFRVVGIEPATVSILALKSANHFRADFGSMASAIINVESPSAIIEDPGKIPYTQLREGVRLQGLGPVFHRPM